MERTVPTRATDFRIMNENASPDPTDRLENSPSDALYVNAAMGILVAAFLAFWIFTAYVVF